MKDVFLGELIVPAKVARAGDKDYPILSMTMHRGLIDQDKKFKKRVASKDLSQYRVVTKNQLVVGFPIDEGVLSFQRLYEKAIVSPAYGIWDLSSDKYEVEPVFLERFLRSPRALSFYLTKLRGSTARRRSLPKEIFLSLRVPLPHVAEQRRIVDVLDRTDELRVKRRRAIEQLETLKQSIFLDMFGDLFSHERSTEGIPLEDLIDADRPITYGIVQPGPHDERGVPYVRVLDMQAGTVNSSSLRRTTPEIAKKYQRSSIKEGDVLLSIRGHVGRVAIVPPELHGANLTQDTARLAPLGISNVYLAECLRAPSIRHWMARHIKGVAVRGINLADVKKAPIPVPPLEAQEVFETVSSEVDKSVNVGFDSQARLHDLFRSLQHRAFSGAL